MRYQETEVNGEIEIVCPNCKIRHVLHVGTSMYPKNYSSTTILDHYDEVEGFNIYKDCSCKTRLLLKFIVN